MGVMPGLKAFVCAVLGGIGNIPARPWADSSSDDRDVCRREQLVDLQGRDRLRGVDPDSAPPSRRTARPPNDRKSLTVCQKPILPVRRARRLFRRMVFSDRIDPISSMSSPVSASISSSGQPQPGKRIHWPVSLGHAVHGNWRLPLGACTIFLDPICSVRTAATAGRRERSSSARCSSRLVRLGRGSADRVPSLRLRVTISPVTLALARSSA